MEILGNIVTTEAPLTVTVPALLNAGGTPSILSDTLANRPAFGTAGRWFLATDVGQLYRDTGAAWSLFGNTPAGTDSQIQFNSSGALGASSSFTWTTGTNTLTLGGVDTGIVINGVTNEPAAPPAGTGRLYARSYAGRVLPKWIGPSGIDYPLQSHLAFSGARAWRGGAGTAGTTTVNVIGAMPFTSAAGSFQIPALATTNLLTSTVRSRLNTTAAANNVASIFATFATLWRGNAAGLGGFLAIYRFGMGALQPGARVFVGLSDTASAPAAVDPLTTTTPGGIGIACNSNTGNWSIVSNITGTARTATNLGASFPVDTTSLMELVLFSPPNGSGISYRVTNCSTGATTTGTVTTNIPANTTFMTPSISSSSTTAAVQSIDIIGVYIETDY